jgi:hypothetical protein
LAPPLNREPGAGWDGQWHPDPDAVTFLASLTSGAAMVVAKQEPGGEEVTRYPATVVATDAPVPWVELEARWTIHEIDVSGLIFSPGDTLREFFSPVHPYNAFAVYAPDDSLRGWYGNVTYPAFVTWEDGEPVLVWRDLYLDAVILVTGETFLLDDDELAASGLPAASPDFAAAIVQAREDLLAAIPAFHPRVGS